MRISQLKQRIGKQNYEMADKRNFLNTKSYSFETDGNR